MAKRRERPAANPLLKDRVSAIVGPAEPLPADDASPRDDDRDHAGLLPPRAVEKTASRRPERGKATVQIKTRFPREEAEEVDRFTRTLSSYLNTTVKGSEITRALWRLAIQSGDGLADLASRVPKLDRPSNGDRLAMAEYEDAVAEFLLLAMKNTR